MRVILASLITASVPVYAQPDDFGADDKADALCVIAFSAMLGTTSDDELSADDRQGVTSVITYFIGKLKGRHPNLQMTELLSPAYVQSLRDEMVPAVQRCSHEAMQLGTDLEAVGNILTEADASQPPTS